MKKLVLSLIGIMTIGGVLAADKPQKQIACIEEMIKSSTFQSNLDSLVAGRELNQELIDLEKQNFYELIANEMTTSCLTSENLPIFNAKIANSEKLQIPFKKGGKYYHLNINTDNLFDYFTLPTAVIVAPFKNKKPGDIIKIQDMPTQKKHFITSACTAANPTGNIPNSSPINTAGKAAFQPYAEREFFVDFPKSKNMRAFPGMVIASTTGLAGTEEVVWYTNYKHAHQAASAFAQGLNGTACGNQNLAVYLVKLDKTLKHSDVNALPGWLRTTLVVLTVPLSFAALKVDKLADLDSVVVLDGPYIVK